MRKPVSVSFRHFVWPRSSSFTYLQNLSDEFRVMLLHIWHLCWTFAQPHWQAESCNGSMSSIFSWRQCSSPAKVEAVTTLDCDMTRSFSWTPYWEKNHKEMQCFVTSLFSFDTKRNIHSTINRVRWPHPQWHSTFSETSWSYNVNRGMECITFLSLQHKFKQSQVYSTWEEFSIAFIVHDISYKEHSNWPLCCFRLLWGQY